MKIKQLYISCAIISFNTAVLFIIINLFLGVFHWVVDVVRFDRHPSVIEAPKRSAVNKWFYDDGSPVDNGKRGEFQLTWFDYRAYEDLVEPEYVAQVLDDFYELGGRGFIYQPWCQFSEPVYSGKLVHIDRNEQGFPLRRTINPPQTKGVPTVRIFVMGGSTTFGYNVSDEHTWPTFLSQELNHRAQVEGLDIQIEVLNYGRGYFYPSQESVLLLDLVKSGYRPDVVIFMDGVNKGGVEDIPDLTDKFRQDFKNMQFAPVEQNAMRNALRWLPLLRLTDSLRYRVGRFFLPKEKTMPPPQQSNAPGQQPNEQERMIQLVEYYLNRFEQSREISEAICELYQIEPLFFLQPTWRYKYSFDHFRPVLQEQIKEADGLEIERLFYEGMHSQEQIILLDHLFQLWGEEKRAMVDNCHYSPQFNRFLAQSVANHINLRELADKQSTLFLNEDEATGAAREFISENPLKEEKQ